MDYSLVKLRKIFLVAGDVFILYFSLWIILLVRYYKQFDLSIWNRHFVPFSLVYFLWLLIFFALGFYEIENRINDLEFISNLLKATAINIVLAIIFFYTFTTTLTISPKTNLFLITLIFIPLFFIWHKLYNFCLKKNTNNNILIIAENSNEQIVELANTIRDNPQIGYNTVSILENNFYNLKEKVAQNNIKTVITAVNPHFNKTITQELFDCLVLKIDIYSLTEFYEKITGKVPVSVIAKTWFLENLARRETKIDMFVKRILDIIFAIIVSFFSIILFPFIAFAIKWESAGPVFYKQQRIGENGRIFNLIKYRSMYIDAEQNGAQWAQENDNRVTSVGGFLRKTRLDEFPQIINVMRGEMSFVGPRPERPEFVSMLQEKIPYYQQRLLVKPGLTGWAQIKFPYGATERDALEKLQYDLYYIKNQKISFDLSILLKTIKIVINAQGR